MWKRSCCSARRRGSLPIRIGIAMTTPRRTAGDLDSPWKEALEHFLAPFLSLYFPAAHSIIDWGRGYESLDKELQQVVRDARIGRRLADKLFKKANAVGL